jgi:hypothetical protein
MFWTCFTYDHKRSYYIYYPQTEAQITEIEKRMDALNNNKIKEEYLVIFFEQERKKERK